MTSIAPIASRPRLWSLPTAAINGEAVRCLTPTTLMAKMAKWPPGLAANWCRTSRRGTAPSISRNCGRSAGYPPVLGGRLILGSSGSINFTFSLVIRAIACGTTSGPTLDEALRQRYIMICRPQNLWNSSGTPPSPPTLAKGLELTPQSTRKRIAIVKFSEHRVFGYISERRAIAQ
jgi:hypothetical protein